MSSLPLSLIITLMVTVTAFFILIRAKHLIKILLLLEYLSLLTLFSVSISSALITNALSIFLILTLAVCEATLGLSLLVSVSREFGSELVNSNS